MRTTGRSREQAFLFHSFVFGILKVPPPVMFWNNFQACSLKPGSATNRDVTLTLPRLRTHSYTTILTATLCWDWGHVSFIIHLLHVNIFIRFFFCKRKFLGISENKKEPFDYASVVNSVLLLEAHFTKRSDVQRKIKGDSKKQPDWLHCFRSVMRHILQRQHNPDVYFLMNK